MRKLMINNTQIYFADKIIKEDNNVKLINAKQEVDDEMQELGNLLFPNISKIDDYAIEDGKPFDIVVTEQQRIDELELMYLMDKGLV